MIDSVDTLTSKIHAYMYGHFEISIFSPQMEIFMKLIYSRKSCYSIKFRILSKNMRWYIPYPWQLYACKMLLSIKLMLFHNWKIVRALWARTSIKISRYEFFIFWQRNFLIIHNLHILICLQNWAHRVETIWISVPNNLGARLSSGP